MRAMFRSGRALLRSAAPLLLALLVASPAVAGQEPPFSAHAFRKLVERTRQAVVPVVSEPRGTAVLVGVRGDLLAPARLVRGGALTVAIGGERLRAAVVRVDAATQLALLALESPEGASFPAATVGSEASLQKGEPLLALAFDRTGALLTPTGRFEGVLAGKDGARLRTSVPGPLGAALFNRRGELVAVHAGRRLTTFGIDAVKERLAGSAAQ
ncbi:MAG: trypsin-like peptidase domain-containing protein, partial [Myxococcales bacterium]